MTVWFVGVDLAWSDRNPSGVAILSGGADHPLEYAGSETCGSTEEIAAPILALDGPVWVAIDAPLVVPNATGQRPVDRLVTRLYGRFDAGAHSASLKQLKHDVRAATLVELLAPRGVCQLDEVGLPPRAAGSWAFETYPHPAMIELFGLDRIIKYKKGRVDQKRAGLRTLAGTLADQLPPLDPPLPTSDALSSLLDCDPWQLRGRALKGLEDRLDALFCAYVAAHLWRWGVERNRHLGSAETGSIVLPAVRGDIDRARRA